MTFRLRFPHLLLPCVALAAFVGLSVQTASGQRDDLIAQAAVIEAKIQDVSKDRDRAERRKKIEGLKRQLKAVEGQLEAVPYQEPVVNNRAMSVGDRGLAIDGSSAHSMSGSVVHSIAPVVNVVQVVDDSNLIGELSGVTVWVTDIDTTGIVDGGYFEIPHHIEVVGTKQYGTVIGGSRKLHQIKLVDITKEIELAKSRWVEDVSREWTAGKHKCVAWLARIEPYQVVLVKPDGTSVKIAERLLSEDDRAVVQKERLRRKAIESKAVESYRKRASISMDDPSIGLGVFVD